MPILGERQRILIVDNEPNILLSLSYALQREGIEVITANTLATAERALSHGHFDLVIADVRMSGMLSTEGLELLSYIKRNWPWTKVIIMSASGSEEVRNDAYERGADYYFDKPFDITELTMRIQEIGVLPAV